MQTCNFAQVLLRMDRDWKDKKYGKKRIFRTQLHDGEVEVMSLGQELNADLLVIDDYVARKYAKYLGFNTIGTVGILLLTKSKGLIHQIKPLGIGWWQKNLCP